MADPAVKLTKAREDALRVIGDGCSEAFLERKLNRHRVASRAFLDRLIASGLATERKVAHETISFVFPTDKGRALLDALKDEGEGRCG